MVSPFSALQKGCHSSPPKHCCQIYDVKCGTEVLYCLSVQDALRRAVAEDTSLAEQYPELASLVAKNEAEAEKEKGSKAFNEKRSDVMSTVPSASLSEMQWFCLMPAWWTILQDRATCIILM